MATKNNPGYFDCYSNAMPDEPMFILLGRDPNAPSLVESWAREREINGEDQAKVDEALGCAISMRRWLEKLGKKEEPVSPVGAYLWAAIVHHGSMHSKVYCLTVEREIALATKQLTGYVNDPEQFVPGADITAIEYVGAVSA